jgi:transposase-like protein
MTPIDAAIEAIESCKPSASFSYREVAKRFGVDRTTLSQRHKGKTQSHATASEQQQVLSPPQEQELV